MNGCLPTMSTSREVDDGPAVLQLYRWKSSQPHLELSKFREAFISPTRRLFGLLSDHGDLILSMTNVDQSQVESPSLSDSCSPVVFDCFSSIPRVKSLAWGQCYNASSQLEDSIFNEVLVVSDDDSITLHGFCHSYKSTLTDNSKLDTGDLHGEWKEWRPTQCSVPEDDEAGTKNSFRSFLTTISGSVSDGKYQAKFPLKSSLPHSAEVVSFSIYDITLSFIKFWSSNYPSKTWMQNDTKSQQGFLGHVPTTETSCNCQWECLKVLPSSSGYLIGLVLIRNEPVSCEVHQRNMKDILVVVIELNQWGIQWNFVADLQNVYDGAVPNQQWVDFQLSDDFLACLNSGGFVVIWNVRTCNIAASFSVLERCRTDIDIPMGSITPTVKTSDGENIYIGNHARRMFKRLVLASYSLVLAVVDEVGVIYLFYAKDILDFKTSMHGNFHPPSMFYRGDSFAAWEAAGHDIGSVTFCCHRSVQQLVYDFSERDNPGVVRPRKRRKHCSSNENQVDSWPSGFSTTTPMKDGLAYPDTMAVSNPLRRVILPPCRLQENIISLSPFGLTRIFKSHNADGNKHFRIVHTNFLMASLHLDERDIDASFLKRSSFQKDSTFTGECVLCSFQGYVYLITQDSLSVVLPSISVSSFSSHNNGIKFWQPTSAGGSACDALNLSSVNRPETRWKPWQIEVLDRALLYEGPAFADRLCWENGWDLKFSRLRWLQLALHYTKISDLEQSLNMLVEVNLAEEGVLQLLLASVYRLLSRAESDSEVAASSNVKTG